MDIELVLRKLGRILVSEADYRIGIVYDPSRISSSLLTHTSKRKEKINLNYSTHNASADFASWSYAFSRTDL